MDKTTIKTKSLLTLVERYNHCQMEVTFRDYYFCQQNNSVSYYPKDTKVYSFDILKIFFGGFGL